MKYIKKLLIINYFIILIFLLSSCQNKNVISAKQTVLAITNFIVFQDLTEINDLGLIEDNGENLIQNLQKNAINSLKNIFIENDVDISDLKAKQIFDLEIELFKKLDMQFKEKDLQKNIETIEITTNKIPISKALENAKNIFLKKIKNINKNNKTEICSILVDCIIEQMKITKPTNNYTTFLVDCFKKEYEINGRKKVLFIPDDINLFIQNIFQNIQE